MQSYSGLGSSAALSLGYGTGLGSVGSSGASGDEPGECVSPSFARMLEADDFDLDEALDKMWVGELARVQRLPVGIEHGAWFLSSAGLNARNKERNCN